MLPKIRAKLIVRLRGGLPDFAQAEDGGKRWVKGNIYLLPLDYDFSNGYFEKIESKKKIKELKEIKEVK